MALDCIWDVKSLEDFLYYCCPECNERKQSRESFLFHALNQHPESHDFLVQYNNQIKEELDVKVYANNDDEEAYMIDEKYEPMVKIKEENSEEEITNVKTGNQWIKEDIPFTSWAQWSEKNLIYMK